MKLELKLVRSPIGTPQWMRSVVKCLALRKIGQSRQVTDSASIRGMVRCVPHLVTMTEIKD